MLTPLTQTVIAVLHEIAGRGPSGHLQQENIVRDIQEYELACPFDHIGMPQVVLELST